jgi:hypothetical protein
LAVIAAGPAQAHTGAPAASHILKPNKTNNLDCNAWSNAYKSIAPEHKMLCADPHGPLSTGYSSGSNPPSRFWSRFRDNGHYVGHDEPSVKFISGTAGSGNTMTYFMRLPHDPTKKATNDGKVVDAAELSPAIWFGLPICDPKSYPQNPCTPDSDANSGAINDPNAAGSAFMELQFYAPGFTGPDEPGCLRTKWCRLSIDSAVEFRQPEPGLPGAAELRVPAAQWRAGRTARPAAIEHSLSDAERRDPDVQFWLRTEGLHQRPGRGIHHEGH